MSDIVGFAIWSIWLQSLSAAISAKPPSMSYTHSPRSVIRSKWSKLISDTRFWYVTDGRNGVHPTPAGEFVLAWARVVLPQKKETFRMAKAIHDGPVPPLRMGFSSFVNSFLLDNFRLVYQGMFPDCDIQLSGADTQHILERLEAGILDCALLPMPIDRDRWDVREVAHSPLVICMRSDDPLSTLAQVDIREVASRGKVFRDPELYPGAHARLSEMFSELGIDLHLASSAATPSDIQMMVKQSYGLALIDQIWPLDSGLVTRPLAGLKWTADTAFVTARGQKHMALYVSVSRASQDAKIYTDNAQQLGDHLSSDMSNTSALDQHKQVAGLSMHKQQPPIFDAKKELPPGGPTADSEVSPQIVEQRKVPSFDQGMEM